MRDHMRNRVLIAVGMYLFVFLCACHAAFTEDLSGIPEPMRSSVEQAIAKVKPALVRILVVSADYQGGREVKYESAGSGVIITKEGHVITNHHVAGSATRLKCTLANKEELEAELVGKDPLTDIAVIKLLPDTPREFPTASFGDSSQVRVGDTVLAMGSPMALSQSVTLGVVSNIELVIPEFLSRWGKVEQDGEDVGSLVRWIAHDAAIFGGNSGGPLVTLSGEIIGINEISIGLGGAIPGNLAQKVAEQLIAQGKVSRAWLGVLLQPRLKSLSVNRGVLVSGVLEGSPAESAGFQSGDILIRLAGQEVDVQYIEQMPGFNQMAADLPIGQPAEAVVLRDGKEVTLTVTPVEREKAAPQQHEFKEWGITARNISTIMAKEMKRPTQDGVLVTSIRPGGPAGEAKPQIEPRDVLVEVNGKPIRNVAELRAATNEILAGKTEPTPVLVGFDRQTERYLTVVKVGIKEIEDPGLEVKKAWLPVKTQVLTRDLAAQMGKPDLTGFRITQVFKNSTAEKAGLKVGDCILAVDGEKLTASAPEDYDDLPQLIRQYREGDTAELTILRGEETLKIPVVLVRAPLLAREMKRYRDRNFEMTVRDITFFDRADRQWAEEQQGVLVEEVQSGGWAAVGLVQTGDLILEIEGEKITDVETVRQVLERLAAAKPKSVVFKVLRGIYTMFLEVQPRWEAAAITDED